MQIYAGEHNVRILQLKFMAKKHTASILYFHCWTGWFTFTGANVDYEYRWVSFARRENETMKTQSSPDTNLIKSYLWSLLESSYSSCSDIAMSYMKRFFFFRDLKDKSSCVDRHLDLYKKCYISVMCCR